MCMRLQTEKMPEHIPEFYPDLHYFALVDKDSREEIDTHTCEKGLDDAIDAFAFYINRVNTARRSSIEKLEAQKQDTSNIKLLDISSMQVERRQYRGPGYCIVVKETYDLQNDIAKRVNEIADL